MRRASSPFRGAATPAGRSLDKDGNNLLDFKEFQKAFLKADEK